MQNPLLLVTEPRTHENIKINLGGTVRGDVGTGFKFECYLLYVGLPGLVFSTEGG
jgi:hypothetical protein